MNLARDKFRRLINDSDKFAEAGVRVNVIGNLGLLPQDLQELIKEAMKVTSSNSKAILNIAISYTSREEMTSAVRHLAQAVSQGELEESDISSDLIERCLYTSVSQSMPDLLVRTSGEVRLSDFMLWQSSYSVTHFTNVLWPDFNLHHLLAAVFHFQSKSLYINEYFDHATRPSEMGDNMEKKERIAKFLASIDNQWASLETTATRDHTANGHGPVSSVAKLTSWC